MNTKSKRTLIEAVRDKIRLKHYSRKTETAYLHWIKRFILFHNKKHPREMGKYDIEQFLTSLAVEHKVSSTTQNQAFNSLLFLYEQVLDISLKDQNIQALRAKQTKHIPVVLTIEEVKKIILYTSGIYQLMLKLLYGCGLRMKEVLNIRIKDIDFGFDKVYIWDSKSSQDRVLPLPLTIKDELKVQVEKVKELHKLDLDEGYGSVYIPYALEKKYPKAKYESKWQYLFPMDKISTDPETGIKRRHHVLESTFNRNIQKAVLKARIDKTVTSHTFRHSYATHLLQNNIDIRSIQVLLGHKSLDSTMIYTHVVKELSKNEIKSPLDF